LQRRAPICPGRRREGKKHYEGATEGQLKAHQKEYTREGKRRFKRKGVPQRNSILEIKGSSLFKELTCQGPH